MRGYTLLLFLGLLFVSCSRPQPGPDKQFAGSIQGAAVGAGAGAVTGLQLGAGTGPGALVGAGVGAVAGGIKGYVKDQSEEDQIKLAVRTQQEREIAVAHEVLHDHYKRRLELHPTRDIYPMDLFFYGDEIIIRPEARQLTKEIAKLNKNRYPWSRLVIASYVKTVDSDSSYARHIAAERSKALGDQFIKAGIEPRRIETRVILVDAPVLIDPNDKPDRYNQAFELIPVDR